MDWPDRSSGYVYTDKTRDPDCMNSEGKAHINVTLRFVSEDGFQVLT